MKAFWYGFLTFGGATLLVFLFFSISTGKGIAELHPTAILSMAEIVLAAGLSAGCLFGLMSWVGKRSKERRETDELMRQYLEKKLREEAENEK